MAFAIGAIIDEGIGHQSIKNYISATRCSKARSLLVLKWSVIGFLLTISYKSVLRAMLMKIEYEATVDTVDDMLLSTRKLMVNKDSGLTQLFKNDPRLKVNQLSKQVEYYNRGMKMPDWVIEG